MIRSKRIINSLKTQSESSQKSLLKSLQKSNLVSIFVLLVLTISSSRSFAQEADQERNSEKSPFQQRLGFGITAGTFLPYGIFGVRDQYPMWGVRFGHPFRIWRLEWAGLFAAAKGTEFYTGSLSIAFEAKVDDVLLIPFLGGDIHYYTGITTTRDLPFRSTFGGHIGLSPTLIVNDDLAARADIKYGFGPGNHLYVGVGLEYCARSSGSKDETPESK